MMKWIRPDYANLQSKKVRLHQSWNNKVVLGRKILFIHRGNKKK